MTKRDAINMIERIRDDRADTWTPLALEARDMAISALERPLKKLPPEKKIDRETHSGYWFAKGWNACLEEIRDRM